MAAEEPRAARPALVLALAAGAAFMAFMDATVVNIAFPALHASFRAASLSGLSWVINAYGITFAGLLAPAGRLADVLGRRTSFLLAVGAFTVASAACAVAPDLLFLIVSRAVQGLSAAGMIPAALALILAETPAERRTRALGVWGAAGSVAAAAGPAVGGALVDLFDWRAAFVVNVPVGVALVVTGTRVLPGDRQRGGRLPDPFGYLGAILGLGLVVLGLTEGPAWGWNSAATIASLIGGAAVSAVSVLRSRHHPAPALDVDLWRDRTFRTANLATLMVGAAMFGRLLSGPLFLTSVWHYSVWRAGLAVTPGPLATAVTAYWAGRRATAGGQRAAIGTGMLIYAASAAWLGVAISDRPAFLAVWLPTTTLGGAGLGIAATGLSVTVARSVAAGKYAAGTGLNTAARQVGGALGVAGISVILSGATTASAAAFRWVFLLVGLIALLSAAVGARLPGRAAH
jgi:EmrB/QacA subfamily drug resistance transporter